MDPKTLQCSPTALAPLPVAATNSVDVTTAPVVGRPMLAAGMLMPFICRHFPCAVVADGELPLSSPLQPTSASVAAQAVNTAIPRRRECHTPMIVIDIESLLVKCSRLDTCVACRRDALCVTATHPANWQV